MHEGQAVSTQRIFIQVWDKNMRNTLVLLYLVICVFLSSWTSYDVCFVQNPESSLCAAWDSFYTQRVYHSGKHEVASYSGTSLLLDQRRTSAFNVLPTCPLALLGTATGAITSFAAPPRLTTLANQLPRWRNGRLPRRSACRHAGACLAGMPIVALEWW